MVILTNGFVIKIVKQLNFKFILIFSILHFNYYFCCHFNNDFIIQYHLLLPLYVVFIANQVGSKFINYFKFIDFFLLHCFMLFI